MKHCPSCNRIYSDDTLSFCLDDGTLLTARPDSEATLVGVPPPVVSLPQTTVWQSPSRVTQPNVTSQNSVLTYAVVALVALLALLAGGGIVFLLRPASGTGPDQSNGPLVNVSPAAPRTDNTSPAMPQTRNDNPQSSLSTYEAIEQSLVRGEPISKSDLASMSQVELRRLRNAIYARHGRMFNTPELQRYFDSRPWYTRRFDYSDRDLTSTDRANLNLIIIDEKGVP